MQTREIGRLAHARRFVSGMLLATVALAPGSRASAQGTAQASFEIIGGDRQSCVTGYQSLTAELIGCPVSPWQGSIVSRASAIDGILKAEGQLVWSGTSPGGFVGQLGNEAKWFDRVQVSGLDASYIDLTIRLTGYASGFVTPGAPTSGGAGVALGFGEGEWPSMQEIGKIQVNGQQCGPTITDCSVSSSIDREITTRFLLRGGVADFGVRLSTPIAISAFLPGTYDVGGASDFSHTLSFMRFDVFDASGANVTNAVTATFEHGTRFITASIAPEPSSFVLMLTGMSLLGWATFGRGIRSVGRRRVRGQSLSSL